ncbi:MAG: polyphosphate kinase 1 [Bacteroidetes bacterium]|nr:polyphosphate kinase 1 [Bacteroidota bacterium]
MSQEFISTNTHGHMENLKDHSLYNNRELSLLDFQKRVFEEAQDEANPILERLKFLSIVGSNLDEFYMVRIGGLKKQVASGTTDVSLDGRSPTEILEVVRDGAHALIQEAHEYLLSNIIPKLAESGVHLLSYSELTDAQKEEAAKKYKQTIFPVLTPLAVDPSHPFPHISNLSLNLAVTIKDELGGERFARVKVPRPIDRLMPIISEPWTMEIDDNLRRVYSFVWIEEVIAANLQSLFPGMEVIASYPFRVTRNADMTIQELEADDLLETMEQGVRQRRLGSVLRVAVNPDMPDRVRNLLIENMGAEEDDVVEVNGPLGLESLMMVASGIDRFDLKYPPFIPFTSIRLKPETRDGDFFKAVRSQNHLLHHPYDSFSPVIEFLEAAASDPNVLAIKMTLYRVGPRSPIVAALMKARENGKQVAVLVELKARFDEESNIGWARMLEREGVHVIYGLIGLKTHSKIALVIRNEGGHIRRYVHMSTGNYNSLTAHVYEDLGLFTVDPQIGSDVSDLFNFLTGYSEKRDYHKLLVAPINLRKRFTELLNREIQHQKDGHKAHLILKTNALVDEKIINLLYEASKAGLKIDLLVRGICCLKPGVEGLSENIRVISIVSRFLEHSRIYYFHNGGDEEVYLGSADLMPRNLNRRVEVLFPIHDSHHVRYLRDNVLESYLRDSIKARYLTDESYSRPEPFEGNLGVQDKLLNVRSDWVEQEKEHLWELF